MLGSIRQMPRENATIDPDATTPDEPRPTTDATATPESATIAATTPAETPGSSHNAVTIIGRGSPSSFELTVDGEIELLEGDADAIPAVVSGSSAEGAIESGTIRFRFTGDLTDVTFVDRGVTGQSPATVPNVHVDYPAPEQPRS